MWSHRHAAVVPLAVVVATTVLLMLAVYASALQFLSSTEPVEYIGATPRIVPKRLIRCTQSDYDVPISFQIQDNAGEVHTATVTCNRVQREYDLHYYAKIPRTGRLMTSTVSLSRNSARYLQSNLTDAANIPSQVPFTQRHLLKATIDPCQWQDNSINGDFQQSRCETTGFFTYPGVAIILKVKTTGGGILPTDWNTLRDGPPRVHLGPSVDGGLINCTIINHDYSNCPSGARAPGIAELAASACVGQNVAYVNLTDNGDTAYNVPCYNGITRQQFDVLVNSSADMTRAFDQFGRSFQKVTLASANVFGNFSLASSYFNSYAGEMNQTSWSLQIQQTHEMDMANLISEAVRRTLHNHSVALDQIAENLGLLDANLARVANTTEDAFDRRLSRNAAHRNAEIQVLQGVVDAIDGDEDIEFRQLRASQKGISDFVTQMQRAVNKDDLLDLQSKQIQDGFDDPTTYMSTFDTQMYAFSENLGVKPVENENDLGPTLSTIVVTNDTFRGAFVMEDSNLYGVVTTMVRRCGSAFMVNKAPFNPTWRDILTLDGPGGCSTNYTGYEPAWIRCNCWNEVLEERCLLSSPSVISDWIVSGAESDGCLTGYRAFPGGNNNTTPARTASDLGQAFAVIAQRGPPAYGSAYFARDRTGLSSFLPYDDGLRNVSNFITMINAPTEGVVNLAVWYAQVIEYAYQEVYNNLDQLRVIIKGSPANFMTQSEQLFTRYAAGDGQSSTTFSIMFYEPYFLTVSTLMLVSVEGSIDVAIDGGAPTRITDITLANTRDNLLRHDKMNAKVFDPLRLDADEYDTPPRAVSFSPATARGTLMYPAVADEAQFTRDQYQAIRGVPFVHTWGDHVASWYLVGLDSNTSSVTYGQCLEQMKPSSGDWCLRRKHFLMSYTGPYDDFGRPGKLMLGDIDSTMTGQIDLLAGQVTLTVASVCPTISQIASIGDDVDVLLTNTRPDAIPNLFLVQEVGACPDSKEITLQRGQSFTWTATKCALAPADTPDVLTFSYQDETGRWIQCPATVPLVYTAQTATDFEGAGQLGAVHALAARRVDVLYAAMHTSELQLLSAMQEQNTDTLRKEASVGFKLNDDPDDSVFDDILAYNQELDDLKAEATAITLEGRNNFTDGLQADKLQQFDDQMAAAYGTFAASYAADLADAEAMNDAILASESSLESQEEFLAENHNDAGDATASFGFFAIGLQNGVQADIRNNPKTVFVGVDSPWDKVERFLAATLQGGGAFALIGLYIGKFFGWMQNAFDTSGNGSLSGLMLGLVGAVLALLGIALAIVTGVKLYRFFFSQNDASKSELAVSGELKKDFPLGADANNDRL